MLCVNYVHNVYVYTVCAMYYSHYSMAGMLEDLHTEDLYSLLHLCMCSSKQFN